jgi:L-aminopeptidase/D-esterase-like protein
VASLRAVCNEFIDPLFWGAAYAAEEAILNALLRAETMTGRDGLKAVALPHERLMEVMREHKRLR